MQINRFTIFNICLLLFSLVQLRYLPFTPKFIEDKFIYNLFGDKDSILINNKILEFNRFFFGKTYLLSSNLNHELLVTLSTWDIENIDINELNKAIINLINQKTYLFKNKNNIDLSRLKKIILEEKLCLNEERIINLEDLKSQDKSYIKSTLDKIYYVINPFKNNQYSCVVKTQF